MMKRHWLRCMLPLVALLLLPLASGCAKPGKHEIAGTLAGGALGAGTGAIIGNQTGHAGTGTAIGAGIGAAAGNLIGRGIDEASRSNEYADPPATYSQGTVPQTGYPASSYSAPAGAPPPPPPPGHYEWDPVSQRWIWKYDNTYSTY